jgi:Pex19 protein family
LILQHRLDVLSQFTTSLKVTPPPPPPTANSASTFGQELAKGMEDLMRELSAESSTSARELNNKKAVWEQMLVEGMDGAPGVGQFSGDSGFQDKIKQAVNKLKESESNLQVNFIILFSISFPSLTKILEI